MIARIKELFGKIGPTIIVAAVVLGPGSILTSSKVGASFGFPAWFVLTLSTFLMIGMVALAARLGVKPAQTALAWVLANATVTAPIIGVTKLSQLQDAVDAMALELSEEDMFALQEPYQPHAVAGV